VWLLVEYRHMTEDLLFQVVLRDETCSFQALHGGVVTLLQTATVEETGHLLRRDLLMTLEDLEDEL
jgi:hypothetical protein